jgi:pilus assembly protein CpaB
VVSGRRGIRKLPFCGEEVVTLRTIVIGALALIFGGSAAVGVNLLYRQGGSPPSESVAVLVAARNIPRGQMLTSDVIRKREFPKDYVPDGALTKIEDAVERIAFQTLVKDEPLLEGKLSAKHAKGGLAGLVPRGMRAFTIQTPHVAAGVAGFILPGNKVDVLLTMSGPGANDATGGAVTSTLLQNVEILAVDQRLDAPTENRVDMRSLQSVTLLVTPDQAAMLDLGQNKGTLHLTLRNPDDSVAAQASPATLSGLLFHQEKPWSEQAKDFIEALAKLKAAPKPQEAAPKEEQPDATLEIRTLRGIYSGAVQLEPIRPRSDDRGR